MTCGESGPASGECSRSSAERHSSASDGAVALRQACGGNRSGTTWTSAAGMTRFEKAYRAAHQARASVASALARALEAWRAQGRAAL